MQDRMTKLLLILIVVVSTNSSPLEEDFSRPYWSNDPPDPDTFGPNWLQNSGQNDTIELSISDPSSLIKRRVKRDPQIDNLKAPLERLQMIARITNGISLQKNPSTIDAQLLISELLFFGGVTPQDISQISADKMQTAFTTLKNYPTLLALTDKKAQDAEKFLEAMEAILNVIDGMGDIEKFSPDGFIKEVDALAAKDITFVAPPDFETDYQACQVALAKFLNDKSKIEGSHFEDVKKFLIAITTPNSVKPSVPVHSFSAGMTSILEYFNPVLKTVKAMKTAEKYPLSLRANSRIQQVYADILDGIVKSLVPVNEVVPGLHLVYQAMTSQEQKSRSRDLKLTWGFLNGASDVASISNDLTDPWIRKLVDADSLMTALKKLGDLGVPLAKVQNDLGSTDAASISIVLETIEQLVKISAGVASVKQELKELNECSVVYTSVSVDNIPEIEKKLKAADEKLKTLETLASELNTILDGPDFAKMSSDIIKICEDAATSTDRQVQIKQFREYPNMVNLNVAVEKVYKDVVAINAVQKVGTIRKDAQDLKPLLSDLANHHSELSKSYAKSLKCLQSKPNRKASFAVVAGIKKIREAKQEKVLDDGLALVNKLIGTKEDIDKALLSINELVDVGGKEIDALVKYETAGVDSKNIGSSVQGVSNMRNALAEKDGLVQKILNNLQMVKANKKLLSDPEDVKNLDDLIVLETSIPNMMTSLETFNGGAKPSDSITLKDHAAIFSQAKLVKGLAGSFEQTAGSIGKLKEKVTDPFQKKLLEDVESGLKAMDSMGLNFAKYSTSFDAAGESLEALNLFFTQFTKSLTPTTPEPMAAQNPGGSSDPSGVQQAMNSGDSSTTEAEVSGIDKFFSDYPVYAWLCVVVLLVLSIVGIPTLIGICVCRRPTKMFWKKILCCACKEEKRPVDDADEKLVKARHERMLANNLSKGPPDSEEEPKFEPINLNEKQSLRAVQRILKKFAKQLFNFSETHNVNHLLTHLSDANELLYQFVSVLYNADNTTATVDKQYLTETRALEESQSETSTKWGIYEHNRVKLLDYGKRFENDFYPASYFVFPSGRKVILSQHPRNKTDKSLLTIPKFWWMVKQSKTKSIIMLNYEYETDLSHSLLVEDNPELEAFYNERTHGELGPATFAMKELKRDTNAAWNVQCEKARERQKEEAETRRKKAEAANDPKQQQQQQQQKKKDNEEVKPPPPVRKVIKETKPQTEGVKSKDSKGSKSSIGSKSSTATKSSKMTKPSEGKKGTKSSKGSKSSTGTKSSKGTESSKGSKPTKGSKPVKGSKPAKEEKRKEAGVVTRHWSKQEMKGFDRIEMDAIKKMDEMSDTYQVELRFAPNVSPNVYNPLYFPYLEGATKTYGDLTVRCVKFDMRSSIANGYDHRKLAVKFGNEPEFEVDHYWVINWDPHAPMPLAHVKMTKLYELTQKQDEVLPIIHCSDGGLRTSCLAFGAYMFEKELQSEEETLNFRQHLIDFRKQRPQCSYDEYNYGHAILMFLTLLYWKCNYNLQRDSWKIFEYLQMGLNGLKNGGIKCKADGPPTFVGMEPTVQLEAMKEIIHQRRLVDPEYDKMCKAKEKAIRDKEIEEANEELHQKRLEFQKLEEFEKKRLAKSHPKEEVGVETAEEPLPMQPEAKLERDVDQKTAKEPIPERPQSIETSPLPVQTPGTSAANLHQPEHDETDPEFYDGD